MAQVKFYRGLFGAYLPSSTHKDCIFFATDTNQLLLNDKAYGVSASDSAVLKNAITKVEWETPDTLKFTCANSEHEHLKVTFPVATESLQGLMAATQVVKLKGIEEGAQVNVIENVIVDNVSGNVSGKTLTINGGFAKAADVYTIADAESMVDGKIAKALGSVYEYKGTVTNYTDLPTTGVEPGDVYNVENGWDLYAAGTNVAWNGNAWDPLGGTFDTSTLEGRVDAVEEAAEENAQAILDEKDRAEGIEDGLRTDLGNKTDVANAEGSAFARIAQLNEDINSLTGGNGSVATQINNAINALKGDVTTDGDTLGKLEDLIEAEATKARAAEGANTDAIEAEVTRATGEEARIEGLVTAEANRAKGVEEGLEGRLATAEETIAKLDGADTVAGSVKKQIKDAVQAEADRATGVENGLANRIQALETAVGEDGSVADAIDAAIAALDSTKSSAAEAKAVVTVVETDGVITSVSLEDKDIASASELASYKTANDAAVAAKVASSDFEDFKTANTSAIATAKSEAITEAGENADTKISEAVSALAATKTGDGTFVDVTVTQAGGKITSVSVVENDIASAALLGTLADDATKNTAFGKAAAAQAAANEAAGKASTNATAITNLQNNTVNGKKISENPVLAGGDIALTSYNVNADGFIAATDTVNAAISKLENNLIWHEA